MHSQTIPAEQWTSFLDQFSRAYAGWPVTIEMIQGIAGTQKAAESLPLQGISFDTKGTRPSSILISVGDQSSAHVSHVVDLPLHIRSHEDHNGNIHLRIEPADGPPTLIHLQIPPH
jgi:hypothetical protein